MNKPRFAETFSIDRKKISSNGSVFIVAEAGINHNGDMNLAFELIRKAAKAGADCIKFQTFSTRHCESQYSLKPGYFKGREGSPTKLEFSRNLEFDQTQFKDLKQDRDELGIIFLSMAADHPSLSLLVDIGCPAIKIGSSDTLNFPLFKEIGKTGLPVIYSTGISSVEDVQYGAEYLSKSGVRQMALLQCTSQYPAPYEMMNLKVIGSYKREFGVPVGLSDHSQGLHVSYAAVGMGAMIIEKHFTLSRHLPGVDHIASIEPQELEVFVRCIRDIEKAIGDGHKKLNDCEREHLKTMRKSLFSMEPIKKGATIRKEMVAAKRPGNGILPTEIDAVIGRETIVDIPKDEFIQWNFLK